MKQDRSPLAQDAHADAATLAKLLEVLALIERIAGIEHAPDGPWPDRQAQLSAGRFANTVRARRINALAAEAAVIGAAGLGALIRHRETTGEDCPAAAARLARELREAIERLMRMGGV